MFSSQARQKIETELDTAQRARENGNEGRARVCARRAAGFAIADYFASRAVAAAGASATDLLAQLQTHPGAPEELQKTAGLLLMRVNTDYQFPLPVDLLAETRRLIATLDGLTISQE